MHTSTELKGRPCAMDTTFWRNMFSILKGSLVLAVSDARGEVLLWCIGLGSIEGPQVGIRRLQPFNGQKLCSDRYYRQSDGHRMASTRQ